MRPNYLKLIFAVVLSIYFLWIAYDPMLGSFLDRREVHLLAVIGRLRSYATLDAAHGCTIAIVPVRRA